MFIRCGLHIINTEQIVEVALYNELRVHIVTTAIHSIRAGHHEIELTGEPAKQFLAALPVYEPNLEEEGT